MNDVILFTTAGCHLCALAEAILIKARQYSPLRLIATEISDDDKLVERYGTSIPVVKFADNTEINWPFELKDIELKLEQLSSSRQKTTLIG